MHISDGLRAYGIDRKAVIVVVLLPFLLVSLNCVEASPEKDLASPSHVSLGDSVLVAGVFHYLDVTLPTEHEKICIIAFNGDVEPEPQNRSEKNYYQWEYDNGVWKDSSGYDSSYIDPPQCTLDNTTYSFCLRISQKANPGSWTIKILVDNRETSSTSLKVIIGDFCLFFSTIIGVFKPTIKQKNSLAENELRCCYKERKIETSEENIDKIIDSVLNKQATISKEEKTVNRRLAFPLLNGVSLTKIEQVKSSVFTYPRSKLKELKTVMSGSVFFDKVLEKVDGFWKNFFVIILAAFLVLSCILPIVISLGNDVESVNITIINVQSYPVVGGTWTVMFTTIGCANLTIDAVNGTTWSNLNDSCNLRFLDIKNDNESVYNQWMNDSVFIENYSSNETAFEVSKVFSPGVHILRFQFGDDITYAFNDATNWWNSNWKSRKLITVNASLVDANLNNFSILVKTTDGDLATYAQNDGDDIAFVLFSDNSTKLNHEIEFFNGTSGELVAWVNVTSLSGTSDTNIWMYYNNNACSSQENPTAVWDGNYVGVWHLNETGVGTRYDATVNNNDGTPQNYDGDEATTSGKIGGADDLDGINDRISISDSASLSFTINTLTFEAWVKVDVLPGTETPIIRKENQWAMQFHDSNTIRNLVSTSGTTGWTAANDEDYTFSTGLWYYWTFVYNGANVVHEINAQQVGSTHTVTGNIVDNGNPVYLGYCPYTGDHINGSIDEVRISKSARSSAWISTTYHTENSPSTFLSFGTTEHISPIVSNPIPNDNAMDIAVPPDDFTITINHPAGNKMNITWRTNESGSWKTFNTTTYSGSGVGNGTYNITNTSWADSYLHTYWWSVNVSDGLFWTNKTYRFITRLSNYAPVISNIYPVNSSTEIKRQPQCQIWVNDSEGDILSVNWYENSTGNWQLRNTNVSVTANSTVRYTFSQFNNYGITYYWKVIVNDSYDNATAIYHFRTAHIDTSIDTIIPYEITWSPLMINATGDSGLNNVTIWYYYSSQNSSWWNSNWQYRKQLSISGKNGGYQMKIIIGNTSGGNVTCNSHARSNFGDIRFVSYSDNSTELSFWLKNYTAGTQATFWVNNSRNDTSIWLYYGNRNASTTSNGDNTFYFFDDFSNGLSKWVMDSWNTDSIYINQSQGNSAPALRHNPDNSIPANRTYQDTRIRTAYKILNGIIEYDVYLAGTPRIIHQFGWRANGLSWTNGYCWRLQNSADDGGFFEFSAPATWTQIGTAFPVVSTGTWYHVKINVSGSTYSTKITPSAPAGDSARSVTDATKTTADYLVSHVHGVSMDSGNYVLVDNVFVRKYWATPPTWNSFGSEQTGYVKWNNASNPDTSLPWNWNFNFPNGYGYYWFYSIAVDVNGNKEDTPNTADARCHYIMPIAPVINSYDLRNSSGSKLNNATGLLDVNHEYYFTINVTAKYGWVYIDYIDIKTWYDQGSETSSYNQTSGSNLNMYLRYENVTGTASFKLLWPKNEVKLITENCSQTTVNSITRIIKISFEPLNQTRWACSNNTWDTTKNTTNDPFSWNFNITAIDMSGLKATKKDEYGVYKFATIFPEKNWVDVEAPPGYFATTNIVNVTYSSNYNFNISIYFEENLTNFTSGDSLPIANNVYICANADLTDDITADTMFHGIREANAIDIINTSGIFHKNNTNQVVQVQFNVYIPFGTNQGHYTAHVATKIKHKVK